MSTSITGMIQIATAYGVKLDSIYELRVDMEDGTFNELNDVRFGEHTAAIASHVGRIIRNCQNSRIRYKEKAVKRRGEQALEDLKALIKPPRADAVSESHVFTLNIDTNEVLNYTVLYPNTIYPRTVWNCSTLRFEDCMRQLLLTKDAKVVELALTFVGMVMEYRGQGWSNVHMGSSEYADITGGPKNKVVFTFSIAKMVDNVAGKNGTEVIQKNA